MPRLHATPAHFARIAVHVAAGEPTAVAIVARMRDIAAADPTVDSAASAESAAALYALNADPAYAASAFRHLQLTIAPGSNGNLTLAGWAMTASIVADCCRAGLSEADNAQLDAILYNLYARQLDVPHHNGNPHDVNNNHWAVSHSGALLALLALRDSPGFSPPADAPMTIDHAIDWARHRVAAFINHHGDRGLYHEGLGYMAYPASFWIPAVLALRNAGIVDLAARYENLRHIAASLYAVAVARPLIPDDQPDGQIAPHIGMKLSWNDDGPGWPAGNIVATSLALADPRQLPGLRWMYDRLSGLQGDAQFAPMFNGLFFSLLHYPYDTPAAEPAGILPLHYTDSRQGLTILRNRYRDADDSVLGVYARATFVGGHAQDDAGSVRLMSMGHDWITGGGQARGEPQWQSVVTSSGPRPKPLGCGAVLHDEPLPTGGVVGVDLRRVSIGYHERLLAVNFAAPLGGNLAVAMLDQIEDHLTRDWTWHLTPGPTLKIEVTQSGFRLVATDGPVLTATFLGPNQPSEIRIDTMPQSSRSFQSGGKRVYPGRPYVSAKFANAKPLAIFVAMTLGDGTEPLPRITQGTSLSAGGREWRNPFGSALPATYRPGVSGSLCRQPGGE